MLHDCATSRPSMILRKTPSSFVTVPLVHSPPQGLAVHLASNQSLDAMGRTIAVMLVASGAVLTGMVSVFLGAWPVLLWSVVEVAALVAAFSWIGRRSLLAESVEAKGDDLVWRLYDSRTLQQVQERRFNRHWATLVVRSAGVRCQVSIRYSGRMFPLGQVVSDERRAALVRELSPFVRVEYQVS
jgi:uncharacterized membrane protein